MYYSPYIQPQFNPVQYQQPQPQYIQQPQMQQNATQQALPHQPDERIWVQGEGAAQAYLVAPNSFVRLWDSTAQVFYEKRADASGKPSMIIYEYKALNGNSQTSPSEASINYTEQINALKAQISALEERMNNYDADESYADDARVYEVQEPVQRRSTGRGSKTGVTRKD